MSLGVSTERGSMGKVYAYALTDVREAGWLVFASAAFLDPRDIRVNDGFIMSPESRHLGAYDVAERLGIINDGGQLASGYQVLPDAFGLYVGYAGQLSPGYVATLGMMARLARPAVDAQDPGAEILSDPAEIIAYRETFEALAA